MRLLRSVAVAWALLMLSSIACADPAKPPTQGQAVHWQVAVLPTQAKIGDEVEVVFTADIASGWILYSSDFKLEIGPRPARFTFDANPSLELVGAIAAIGPQRKKDPAFGTYSYFATHAEFRQKARVRAPLQPPSGTINGQVCFEASGVCQLFREAFQLDPKES